MSSHPYSISGGYRHRADRISEIRFPSEGHLERSFSVLISEPESKDDGQIGGLAILDNDNMRVVMDGLDVNRPSGIVGQSLRKAFIETMDWDEFSAFCRLRKEYIPGIVDIDTPRHKPLEGNYLRQSALGLTLDPEKDCRSTFLKELSDDPDVPYVFPPSSIDMMRTEICRHLFFVAKNGLKSELAWDIRMNITWNRTGRVIGMPAVQAENDLNWRHEVSAGSEILAEACRAALEPYLSGPVEILDMEGYPAEFGLAGKNKGFLVLRKFAGHHMSITRDMTMADRLTKLRDDQLEALWACVKVMDVETSEENRARQMELEMHHLRVAYEKA